MGADDGADYRSAVCAVAQVAAALSSSPPGEKLQRAQELLQKFLWLCPDDCPAKESSLGVISALLAVSPEVAKAKMLRGGLDCRGLTALHVAVARSFPKEVVLAILEASPESARDATQNDCDQPPQVLLQLHRSALAAHALPTAPAAQSSGV